MSSSIWVGAVAYDPKVVTIWEGMRRYFVEEAKLPVEIVLFQSYEAQISALLAQPGDGIPRIDIGWNTNLAFVQAESRSANACRPIAMRDTDIGWMTKIVAATGGPIASLGDLRDRTLALGSRDSGHAAILPVYFTRLEGLVADQDYMTSALRHRSRQARRYRNERDRGPARGARWPGRCWGHRQPVLAERAAGAARAGGGADRGMDVAAVQPLHVHRAAQSRDVAAIRVRRGAVRHGF